jgi:levansucrase
MIGKQPEKIMPDRVSNACDSRQGMGVVDISIWSDVHVAQIAGQALPEAALIGAGDLVPAPLDMTLWDIWPVQTDDGALVEVTGGTLWVILSALRCDDPNARHDLARMRLFHRVGDNWHDCGNLLPDGFSPGSREWSGTTRLDPATGEVTLWFTATGRREGGPQFEQRLFLATGWLDLDGAMPRIAGWSNLTQAVVDDGSLYADTAKAENKPGRIKGFRDPCWFRDPQSGVGYLLFTGSQPASASYAAEDGVIGIARANDEKGVTRFTALPPIIDATGVSNELELPHVIYRDGLYYLFWCTQNSVFAEDGPKGPTGLYGMLAKSLFGPYEPLNGSGLVLANPASEPRQAYGWRVLPSLDVIGFVDYWGLQGRDVDGDPALMAAQFGGTIAPMSKIELSGNTARIL